MPASGSAWRLPRALRAAALSTVALLAIGASSCTSDGDTGQLPRGAPPPPEAPPTSARKDPVAKPNPRAHVAIPIEEVAKYPAPGTATPGSIQLSPDGTHLTYLMSPDQSLTRQLMAMDLASGATRVVFTPPEGGATEDNLSPEEKLQRERRRERGLGVTSYAWAHERDRLLVPVRGDLWIQDGLDAEPRKIVDLPDHPALDARLSRQADKLAFVSDDELYVLDIDGGGKPEQITSGARGTGRTHGLAEYIAAEEMGRHVGYWWSWDGGHIAYTEVDETHLPVWRIVHQGRSEPSWEDHGYPFAGEANAKVRLGVVPSGGGKTVWMDVGLDEGDDDDLYLARVHWMPDGGLIAEIENREQTRLEVSRFDVRTGKRTLLFAETSEVWINLHGMFRPLEKATGAEEGGFLWASEESGFRHLQVRDANGDKLRDLTSGEWQVDGVSGIDHVRGIVYFTATKDGATEKQLYAVPLAGGEIRRITEGSGMHGGAVAPKHDRFVDSFSHLGAPTTINVRKLSDGSIVRPLPFPDDPRVAELKLRPPELVEVKTKDGVTLHGAIYHPPKDPYDAPYPTVVSVYGGPHAQRVTDSWGMTADMRAQYLAANGYLVFKLDNRGSARRGLAFEGAIKHDMGNLEVVDQVTGVQYLVEQGLTDPKRVGIIGWSYGGYMSAMALARAPETFQAAIAGAPVTHWDGYDTHYTERYMGTPASNPKGYQQSSVMAHIDGLKGELMIVHGLIDENVHFRHSARLIQALVSAGKDHELFLFPDERHSPRSEQDRRYLETRILKFFDEALASGSAS